MHLMVIACIHWQAIRIEFIHYWWVNYCISVEWVYACLFILSIISNRWISLSFYCFYLNFRLVKELMISYYVDKYFWMFQFDSDRDVVVSGSLDTTIRVWNVRLGICLHTLIGHQSLTSGMQLRGNILVSGNADSTIKACVLLWYFLILNSFYINFVNFFFKIFGNSLVFIIIRYLINFFLSIIICYCHLSLLFIVIVYYHYYYYYY